LKSKALDAKVPIGLFTVLFFHPFLFPFCSLFPALFAPSFLFLFPLCFVTHFFLHPSNPLHFEYAKC
ncbi:hypothetical protein B0H19DRAFT_1184693, partial [Mycena capillaripes]